MKVKVKVKVVDPILWTGWKWRKEGRPGVRVGVGMGEGEGEGRRVRPFGSSPLSPLLEPPPCNI